MLGKLIRERDASDYEDWLSWYQDLDKFSCPVVEQPKKEEEAPKKVQKAREQPVERESETRRSNREARSAPSREAPQRREQRSYSPSSRSSSSGTMGGVGF